ncbi:MAG: Glucose-1-phosphate uridyltransferase AglF [Candidatus Methanohalarchaeum thermophilum]|uniref:glucose-1-phosphate thymidylyltransferase n=1 Tax=Methanohalarchaeum thermophilum TaxID=1903181 RepID=A0A1Q6DSR1_METT1|nr:MAG: Glucose-1-phosphate uridyltransferase AglF [Candidatus Methanohalarchaeum thermophilum]
MVRTAVVLAGGKGSRLNPITNSIPKEMLRVGEKPIIDHIITGLTKVGLNRILVVINRDKKPVMDYLGSGKRFKSDIFYRVQEDAKGTAHALKLAKEFIEKEDFLVIYGDNYLQSYNELQDLIRKHIVSKSSGTLALHYVDNPERYGIVDLKEKNKERVVEDIVEKPKREEVTEYKRDNGWLNIAGAMVLNRRVFNYFDSLKRSKEGEFCLTNLIDLMRVKEEEEEVHGYILEKERIDVGTFSSLVRANRLERKKD